VPIITLTTDFGLVDSYVAQLKGVILGIHPTVAIVDVTHEIPPQDIRRAAGVVSDLVEAFPSGTVHVVVVDPGVGSDRPLVGIEAAGQVFLGPDNGLWSRLVARHTPTRVVRVDRPEYWRSVVSATFHGRDILAPVAARLATGLDLAEVGTLLSGDQRLVVGASPGPVRTASGVAGQVVSVDHFGNLITDIPAEWLPPAPCEGVIVEAGGVRIEEWVRCYADLEPGDIGALIASNGCVEIAVRNGNAGEETGLGAGATVRVRIPVRRV
jgi:S-adenosyl-L-methionine hydrolase (adenosine-forming)